MTRRKRGEPPTPQKPFINARVRGEKGEKRKGGGKAPEKPSITVEPKS